MIERLKVDQEDSLRRKVTWTICFLVFCALLGGAYTFVSEKALGG